MNRRPKLGCNTAIGNGEVDSSILSGSTIFSKASSGVAQLRDIDRPRKVPRRRNNGSGPLITAEAEIVDCKFGCPEDKSVIRAARLP
jgi:hypothetical protein